MARKTKKTASARRRWTDKELGTLKKMAGTRPVGIIAYELSRSVSSIRGKAQSEGISFGSPERSPYGKPVKSAKRAKPKK